MSKKFSYIIGPLPQPDINFIIMKINDFEYDHPPKYLQERCDDA